MEQFVAYENKGVDMMAGIPSKELGYPIQDLSPDRHKLRDAVDFLINGY